MKTAEELQTEKQELLAKYGKLNEVTVFLEEDNSEKTATLFLRKPDKTVRSLVGKIAMNDGIKAVSAFLQNLYIGGDSLEIVLSNDYALASTEEAVVDMLSVQKAILKKN